MHTFIKAVDTTLLLQFGVSTWPRLIPSCEVDQRWRLLLPNPCATSPILALDAENTPWRHHVTRPRHLKTTVLLREEVGAPRAVASNAGPHAPQQAECQESPTLGFGPGTISNSLGTQDTSPGLRHPPFLCLCARDNDTTLLGFVHPVFLGCRLWALLCARSSICLGQGDTSLRSKGLSTLTGEGLSSDPLQGDGGVID